MSITGIGKRSGQSGLGGLVLNQLMSGEGPDSGDQIFRNINCSVVAYNGCFPMPFHSYEPKPIRFRLRTQLRSFHRLLRGAPRVRVSSQAIY